MSGSAGRARTSRTRPLPARARRSPTRASVAFACAFLVGCSPNGASHAAPRCIDDGIDTSCTLAFDPTYDALYANTFAPTCASPGVSCHASTGRQGGVDFGDAESGYASLQSMLVAGKPECSIVAQRVVATDPSVRMPPGRALTEGEQCAIVQWIAAGARR